MKRKESKYAIECNPKCGPIFGCENTKNIFIDDYCFKKNSYYVNYDDRQSAYECHPEYKSSLFVNTARPNGRNYFSVLDYEVFGIDYENRENINKLCKHPDIVWKYIETTDISEESLKQFADDAELLSDLDVIHCEDSSIRARISHYYLKNPSEFLPDTQLIDKKYDQYLREWTDDYKWKLIYRASEHDYRASSFHEYCDDKGPTLVIIKSSEGWIFGGYTTRSWNQRCIQYLKI